jgi:hypothetical protein
MRFHKLRWPADCERIQRVVRSKGYDLTLRECEDIWAHHSDTMCAGWLLLPTEDEDLWFDIQTEVER